MKRLIFTALGFIYGLAMYAAGGGQGGYKIQLQVGDMKNAPAYLDYYMNGKTYSRDTVQLNGKGSGTFISKDGKALDEGTYIIYFNPEKFFDVLIGEEQNLKISVDTANLNGATITGSSVSSDFQDWVKFLTGMNKERGELVNKYKEKKIDSTTYVKTFEEMTAKVESKQKNILETHKNDFLGAYLKGTMPVETPEFNEIPDSIRNRVRYQYFRDHYFDNVDLSDPRFLRTPYFPNMVDKFISKHVLQDPDTLAMVAIDLIEKSRKDTTTFQVMTSKMINYGISSKMMGMDGLWLKIAEKYYFDGTAYWADSAWVESLKKEAKKIRHNLIGMKAHNLIMRDSTNKPINMKDIDAEALLVYFYEPSCGHCKKTTPVLYDSVYTKWKDKGFEVLACYTQLEHKEWMEFIEKNKMYDWYNVWDPYRESWFWEYYDTSATPGVYLLNKERKIIAKKIDMETLDMILEEELVKRKQKQKK